jgi:hypothetical protein
MHLLRTDTMNVSYLCIVMHKEILFVLQTPCVMFCFQWMCIVSYQFPFSITLIISSECGCDCHTHTSLTPSRRPVCSPIISRETYFFLPQQRYKDETEIETLTDPSLLDITEFLLAWMIARWHSCLLCQIKKSLCLCWEEKCDISYFTELLDAMQLKRCTSSLLCTN